MLNDDELLLPLKWQEARKNIPIARLLAGLQADSRPIAKVRLADLFNRNRKTAEARKVLADLGSDLPVAVGMRALVDIDYAVNLPHAERLEVFKAIAALPEDLDAAAPTFPEGQAMLDFARGQAFGELALRTEAARLLQLARRGLQMLGLSDRAAICALERLGDPERRIETHRARLRDVLASGSEHLIPAVADDLVRAAASNFDAASMVEGLAYMHRTPEREALALSAAILRGMRVESPPDTSASAHPTVGVAAYIAHMDQAVLAEQCLQPAEARRLAEAALRSEPVAEDAYAAGVIRVVRARLLLAAGDLTGAAEAVGDDEAPIGPHVLGGLIRLEVALRSGVVDPLARLAELDAVHHSLRLVPEEYQDGLLRSARRLATNATYLLLRRHPVTSAISIPLLANNFQRPTPRTLRCHQEEMRRDPHRFVAFQWYVEPILIHIIAS